MALKRETARGASAAAGGACRPRPPHFRSLLASPKAIGVSNDDVKQNATNFSPGRWAAAAAARGGVKSSTCPLHTSRPRFDARVYHLRDHDICSGVILSHRTVKRRPLLKLMYEHGQRRPAGARIARLSFVNYSSPNKAIVFDRDASILLPSVTSSSTHAKTLSKTAENDGCQPDTQRINQTKPVPERLEAKICCFAVRSLDPEKNVRRVE
ncbi:hypothetical protein EVAR_78663_1 [Eumeta japonica]|uniref:Uncharacterized protein n=1 Tax=Eumeta variegata TaxID=151549 RepID=A0A4C1U9B7_EUMVA|nr:hypothetical protein EVAR_78663_1 [Eumeta japonica]